MRKILNSLGTAFIAASIIDSADKIPVLNLWPDFAIFGLLIIIGVEVWQRFGKKASTTSNLEKIYTRQTPIQIFEDRKNLTTLQAELISKPHLGKWLRMNGIVNNMHGNEDSITVSFSNIDPNKSFDIRGVHFKFDRKLWGPKLETLKKGDPLTTEGRITGIDRLDISLEDCRIIEERDQ